MTKLYFYIIINNAYIYWNEGKILSYSIKALLIVNLHAGKKITKDEILKIKNSLEKKNCIVNVYCTKSKKDATEAVLRLAHDFDVLICCGGDGTFHEVLNGIHKFQ